MLLYNVHTPNKTFSLQHKEGEAFSALLDRIALKASERNVAKSLQEAKESELVYEYKGDRYSLEDDDDLSILTTRYPPNSSPHVTLHLSPPSQSNSSSQQQQQKGTQHAHFAPAPPSYSNTSSASALKNKVQQKEKSKAPNGSALKSGNGKANGHENGDGSEKNEDKAKSETADKSDDQSQSEYINKSESKKTGSKTTSALSSLGAVAPGGKQSYSKSGAKTADTEGDNESVEEQGKETKQQSKSQNGGGAGLHYSAEKQRSGTSQSGRGGNDSQGGRSWKRDLTGDAASVFSSKSRKSKWGDDDAEPLGQVNQRKWESFHANHGVRTVMGKVNNVPNVRMLMIPGHRHVTVSRTFATKNGLVNPKFAMGAGGYTGLKILGDVSITVGKKTASHKAFIAEEEHFDVVLGRSWMEKMHIKSDPYDQTLLTYMDSGETIPCDIVVLKDKEGNKIFIT